MKPWTTHARLSVFAELHMAEDCLQRTRDGIESIDAAVPDPSYAFRQLDHLEDRLRNLRALLASYSRSVVEGRNHA